MLRRTMFFKVKLDADYREVAELRRLVRRTAEEIPCVTLSTLGRNTYHSQMPPDRDPRAWDYVWDLGIDRRANLDAYRKHPYHADVLASYFSPKSPRALVEEMAVVYFEPETYSSANREVLPFKQQLTYQILPNADPARVREFDRMMLEMPRAMPLIRNWCLGTAIDPTPQNPWTRIWEWEFMTQEDFEAYLDHKTHMDVVPFYMGPDEVRLVGALTNAQYQLPESIITYPERA